MQTAFGAHKHASTQLAAQRLRVNFVALLAAALRQPEWRAAAENAEERNAVIELLVKFLTHSSAAVADKVLPPFFVLILSLPCRHDRPEPPCGKLAQSRAVRHPHEGACNKILSQERAAIASQSCVL